MDAGTYLIEFLISFGITFVIILTLYIITRVATHGKIQLKTAKCQQYLFLLIFVNKKQKMKNWF